jgi:hypothetical protein
MVLEIMVATPIVLDEAPSGSTVAAARQKKYSNDLFIAERDQRSTLHQIQIILSLPGNFLFDFSRASLYY